MQNKEFVCGVRRTGKEKPPGSISGGFLLFGARDFSPSPVMITGLKSRALKIAPGLVSHVSQRFHN
jgi:hypothetical protein